MVRVGIVGCGAVTERLHLPAVLSSTMVRLEALVDTAPGRAARLAASVGVEHGFTDMGALIGTVDVAILALPNSMHLEAVRTLAQEGIHVLVEKPMARTVDECEAMIAAAAGHGIVLSIAHVRRFFPWVELVREWLASGFLGRLESIDWREGQPYRWPVLSSLPFDRDAAGGGVLIDVGSHVFDLLRWWRGEGGVVSYEDDALGGVEADCVAHLRDRHGCEARVELSRTRDLRNTVVFTGDRATLEVTLEYDATITLGMRDRGSALAGSVRAQRAPIALIPQSWPMVAAFVEQIDQFAAATRGEPAAIVSGDDGMAAVALVERCYASRGGLIDPFPLPTTSSPAEIA